MLINSKWVNTLLLAGTFLFTGCDDRDEIKVYRVEKEPSKTVMPPASDAQAPVPAEVIKPTSKPPKNWVEQPLTSMRIASYLIKNDKGATADLSLVALGGSAGGVLDNVNRWLNQLGQPPITEENLAKSSQKIKSPAGEIIVVDLEGLSEGADPLKDGRILGGILPGESRSLFFKMRGNKELLGAQKKAFVEWMKSTDKLKSSEVAPTPPPMGDKLPDGHPPLGNTEMAPLPPSAPAPSNDLKWKAPAHWKSKPASGMRLATFTVEGTGGEMLDVSVMPIPGNAGGDLENVNRWRGQVGLEPIQEPELAQSLTLVKTKQIPMNVAELTGATSGMIVAWGRLEDNVWFIKMMGPVGLIKKEKVNFVRFVESIEFSR